MKTDLRYKVKFPIIIRNIIIITLLIIFANMFLSPIIGRADITTKTITISNNDTLWEIASDIINDSNNNGLQVAKVIYDIKEINNMQDSSIYAGQSLNIPIYNW